MLEERTYPSVLVAARTIAADITGALETALRDRGEASLVVSGGRTPKLVLPVLSQADLDWSKITVLLSDERWVATSHHDSNERMVRDYLLDEKAVEAKVIGLKTSHKSPAEAVAEVSKRIEAVPKPFDATFLGMGPDGHIASLFPNGPSLKAGGLCTASHSAGHPHWRISLTGQTLLNSRQIMLMVNGEAKREAYIKARMTDNINKFPVRIVTRQEDVPVTVYLCN